VNGILQSTKTVCNYSANIAMLFIETCLLKLKEQKCMPYTGWAKKWHSFFYTS